MSTAHDAFFGMLGAAERVADQRQSTGTPRVEDIDNLTDAVFAYVNHEGRGALPGAMVRANAERDAARQQRDEMGADLLSVVRERNAARQAHGDALREAEALRQQRDQLAQALRELLTWADGAKYDTSTGYATMKVWTGDVADARELLDQIKNVLP